MSNDRAKLRDRLTVPDAAKHLSERLGRKVTQEDIFEWVSDSELTLSVHFLSGTIAKRCITTHVDQAFLDDAKINPFGKSAQLLAARIMAFSDENEEFGEIVSLAQETETLFDVYDLAMTEVGRLIVENEYQKLKGGPSINYEGISGIYLKKGNEFLYQLQEYHEFSGCVDVLTVFPARTMTKGSIFVVRTIEIERYILSRDCEHLSRNIASTSQLDVPVIQNWPLTKKKRFQGYTEALYLLLESAHIAGERKPSARDVLQAWAVNRPVQIAKVIPGDSIDYYLSTGNTKYVNLKAIGAAIAGMTKKIQSNAKTRQ